MVGNDLLNVHGRRHSVEVEMSWIDFLHNILICEPELAIDGASSRRAEVRYARLSSVECIQHSSLELVAGLP